MLSSADGWSSLFSISGRASWASALSVAAKGEGPLAAAMRAEAEREGVPIVRNIGLARGVWGESEVGGPIPRDRFDAIAEIILWARRARDGLEAPVREDAE